MLAHSADRSVRWIPIGILFLAAWAQVPAWPQAQTAKAGRVEAAELIWEKPNSRLAQDLSDPRNRPQPPFQFVEEDSGGSNPKVKVRDAKRRLWIVKWSEEIHSEVFASRLAAALGYFVRPAFYVREGVIQGVEKLDRAAPYVTQDGSFRDAAFKLIPEEAPYAAGVNWAWTDNPFLESPSGRQQLNGLKIVIMLTSNWDTKDTRDVAQGPNTAVYRTPGKGQIVRYLYAMDDWGASMGRWGHVLTREKWDCDGYTDQTPKFIEGIKDGYVEWGFSGVHTGDITEGITADDVGWLLRGLGSFTDKQIEAALRSSGAEEDEVPCFGKAIRDRIRQLKAVAAGPPR
jgi:hypothetical protein